ncbi:MAG: 23S rRNA pseudouridine(2604) synthase RluF [Crocinitomicaceae bacterium]|nr:23S rRNA pseudouridine(2604) synthase RluF [Crocinitomicaceae bacterium]
MSKQKEIRINKFLSEAGFCSRREADKLIDKNRVKINGKAPLIGTKVIPGDIVTVDKKVINVEKEEFVYLAFNKPKGIVCTTDVKREKNNIIDYLNYPKRIFPVGRLDKLSQGLIFLTSDGDIVNKILRASNDHEKEYLVTVDKAISKEFVQKMSSGLPILGTITKKCEVEKIANKKFKIILTQGLNRQIRRMCEHLNYEVKHLKRVRIMNINLDIREGEWRYFTGKELKKMRQILKKSTKTAI